MAGDGRYSCPGAKRVSWRPQKGFAGLEARGSNDRRRHHKFPVGTRGQRHQKICERGVETAQKRPACAPNTYRWVEQKQIRILRANGRTGADRTASRGERNGLYNQFR